MHDQGLVALCQVREGRNIPRQRQKTLAEAYDHPAGEGAVVGPAPVHVPESTGPGNGTFVRCGLLQSPGVYCGCEAGKHTSDHHHDRCKQSLRAHLHLRKVVGPGHSPVGHPISWGIKEHAPWPLHFSSSRQRVECQRLATSYAMPLIGRACDCARSITTPWYPRRRGVAG